MSILRTTAGLLIAGATVVVTAIPAAGQKPPGLGDPKRPDLVIESISIAPLLCKNGLPHISASATVKNLNTKHAADLSKIPFHQVLKMRVGGNFHYLNPTGSCPGFVDIDPGGPPQIAPGGTWTGTATRCVAPGGTYIWAKADPLNMVAEFRENNNYKARPLDIKDPCKWTP